MKHILFLIACLLIAGCSPQKKAETPVASEVVTPETNDLPKLAITLLSGDIVMTEALKGKNILFFYDPECDHCQREAKDLRAHILAFKDYNVYFICSPRPTGEIDAFAKEYGLTGHPNIQFALAGVAEVVGVMGGIGTPSLYIYNDNGHLVKKFWNETDMQQIVRFL